MKTIPNHIWIVIPTYNEQTYLDTVLKKVLQLTKNIIIVDDGSSDNTVAIANKHIKYVLNHQVNLGKGAALKTGCEFAFNELGAEAVIVMDGDDQHDPNELTDFCQQLEKHQLVFGIRTLSEMPVDRRFSNKLLSILVMIFFGTYVPDILSGYKGFSRAAYQAITWQSSAYGVELEIAIRVSHQKLDFVTIPIKTIYHDYARGMTLLDGLGIIGQILSWRIAL